MHSYARDEAKPSTRRTPIGARWPRARAALPHTDQLGSAAAPSHWDSHQMNEYCKSIHVCDATTSCDVPSRLIRTSEAEDTFTSCQLGLDHPSSKLSMSMCLLPHDWLQNILISNGS